MASMSSLYGLIPTFHDNTLPEYLNGCPYEDCPGTHTSGCQDWCCDRRDFCERKPCKYEGKQHPFEYIHGFFECSDMCSHFNERFQKDNEVPEVSELSKDALARILEAKQVVDCNVRLVGKAKDAIRGVFDAKLLPLVLRNSKQELSCSSKTFQEIVLLLGLEENCPSYLAAAAATAILFHEENGVVISRRALYKVLKWVATADTNGRTWAKP